MHPNSLKLMAHMFESYGMTDGRGRRLYDIGSQDINGSYRPMCEEMGWEYVGVDIICGKNVDVIDIGLKGTEHPFTLDNPTDLVISGQCIEHTKYPWAWIKYVSSYMQKGGLLFLIAPAAWPEHRYPIDCWRFLPDGMRSLAEWAGLKLRDTGLSFAETILTPAEWEGQKRVYDGMFPGIDCWAVMERPE